MIVLTVMWSMLVMLLLTKGIGLSIWQLLIRCHVIIEYTTFTHVLGTIVSVLVAALIMLLPVLLGGNKK